MMIVPLQPVPNQTIVVLLGNQNCTIHVYQKFYGLFIDLLLNDVLVIGGVIVEHFNRIVRSKYLGFVGDIVVFDTVGNDRPEFAFLGDRFQMAYLTPEEADRLPAGR